MVRRTHTRRQLHTGPGHRITVVRVREETPSSMGEVLCTTLTLPTNRGTSWPISAHASPPSLHGAPHTHAASVKHGPGAPHHGRAGKGGDAQQHGRGALHHTHPPHQPRHELAFQCARHPAVAPWCTARSNARQLHAGPGHRIMMVRAREETPSSIWALICTSCTIPSTRGTSRHVSSGAPPSPAHARSSDGRYGYVSMRRARQCTLTAGSQVVSRGSQTQEVVGGTEAHGAKPCTVIAPMEQARPLWCGRATKAARRRAPWGRFTL